MSQSEHPHPCGDFSCPMCYSQQIKQDTPRRSRKTYSEKLTDPRWQQKRLRIFERDGFACRNCGDGTSTLNVHHIVYLSGRDPWEYEDKALLTLCEQCHKDRQDREAALLLLCRNMDNDQLNRLALAIGITEELIAVGQVNEKE